MKDLSAVVPTTQDIRLRLLLSAASSAALRVLGIGVTFVSSIVFARMLGPGGYGTYVFVMSLASILVLAAGLGLPQYLVREVARLKDQSTMPWLLRWADCRVLVVGVIAAGVLVAWGLLSDSAHGSTFFAAALIPLVAPLAELRAGLLQSQNAIARSQWPMLIMGPLLILVSASGIWLTMGLFTPVSLMLATAGAAVAVLIVNSLQLRAYTGGISERPKVMPRVMLALPFLWQSGLYLINNRIDILMLGILSPDSNLGAYAVAARSAELVTFVLVAANVAIAPVMARLYFDSRMDQLQHLFTVAGRYLLLASAPIAILFIVAGGSLIALVYGDEYEAGAGVLRVLAAAQLVSLLAGPVGITLNMTDAASLSARAFGIAAVCNIVMNLVLIPTIGIHGAALSSGVSLLLCTSLRWRYLRARTGLQPGVLGASTALRAGLS